MEEKHLIDWFVRKEGNYVLYGCEKGKKTPIRVENPHIVMEPSGMATIHAEKEVFTMDVLDMDICLFDTEGFENVPAYGLALFVASAVPGMVNKIILSDIFKYPGYKGVTVTAALELCTWYVKTDGKKLKFYGCPVEVGGEEICLVNPDIVCNATGKMLIVKGRKRYKCWIDDVMRPLCDEDAWQQIPPYCRALSLWKETFLEKIVQWRRKAIGQDNLLEASVFEGFVYLNDECMRGERM